MSQSIRVPAMQVPRITFLYCFLAVLLPRPQRAADAVMARAVLRGRSALDARRPSLHRIRDRSCTDSSNPTNRL
jgi:hypothetical protein